MNIALLLLVEDEQMISDLLEHALSEAGFEFILARNGQEAEAILEKRGTEFRGLITDIRIGDGFDGWDVAHRARELVPEMAIVYITGDSAVDWTSKGVPKSLIIQKPFAPAQVVTAIAQLLNQANIP